MDTNADLEKGPGHYISVQIRSLTGQTQTVGGVPQQGTVMDLKSRVQAALGIPTTSQRLIYSGRELSGDDSLLSDFSIQDQTVVHMVIRSEGPYVNQAEEGAYEQGMGRRAVAVEFGGENVYETYRLSRFVMIFAWIDLFFLFLYSLFLPWVFIALLFPMSAIYAVRKFEYRFLIPYGLFIIAEVALRIFSIASKYERSVAFSIIIIIVDFYIFHLVVRLYNKMMSLSPEQRQQLSVFGPPHYY